MIHKYTTIFLLIFNVGTCCATDIRDPFEGVNRVVLDFNLVFDRILLRPLSTVYTKATPQYVQSGMHAVLNNLKEPVTFLSQCAQGEPQKALTTLMRFIINSTFGLAGFIRLGESIGLEPCEQNYGHTLRRWGVPQGPYVMLPLLGPSSPRDLVSKAGNFALNPVTSLYSKNHPTRDALLMASFDLTDKRSQNLQSGHNLQKSSLDFYATVRSIFQQKTQNEVYPSSQGSSGLDDKGPEPQNDDETGGANP